MSTWNTLPVINLTSDPPFKSKPSKPSVEKKAEEDKHPVVKSITKTVVRQDWLESERGWGQRDDGYSLHKSKADRDAYVAEYWKRMPDDVPDEYSRPCGEPYLIDVPIETYERIENSKNGIRVY